jgi:hypothetical protein
MFRKSMGGRGKIKSSSIADLTTHDDKPEDISVEKIFAELRAEPMTSARNLLAHLEQQAADPKAAQELMDKARLLVFLKGDDAHDYKFSSAILEDYYHVSPEWRNQFLAANALMLPSSADRDNQLVERARAALGA